MGGGGYSGRLLLTFYMKGVQYPHNINVVYKKNTAIYHNLCILHCTASAWSDVGGSIPNIEKKTILSTGHPPATCGVLYIRCLLAARITESLLSKFMNLKKCYIIKPSLGI